MARKTSLKKAAAKTPAAVKIDEKTLTKGELRKLNMLRKSVGTKLGETTFAKWYAEKEVAAPATDMNATLIAQALEPLVKSNKIKLPRGGYLLRRGRGRVIVEPAKS